MSCKFSFVKTATFKIFVLNKEKKVVKDFCWYYKLFSVIKSLKFVVHNKFK